MILITKTTKYMARARQATDFSNKIPGYDFSYPVLNTIDITNLLMSGGSKVLQIERMGQPKWSYDTKTKELSVEQNGCTTTHLVYNPEELGDAMSKYFDENIQALAAENFATSMKKSASKLGNQNAKKDNKPDINPSGIVNTEPPQHPNANGTDKQNAANLVNNDYPFDFLHNLPKFAKAVKDNPMDYCSLDEFLQLPGKTIAEYFYWVVGKGWLNSLNLPTCERIKKEGFNIQLAFDYVGKIRHYVQLGE